MSTLHPGGFSVGNAISMTLDVYKQNWLRFSLLALVPMLLVFAMMVASFGFFFFVSVSGPDAASSEQVADAMASAAIPGILGVIVALLVYVIFQIMLTLMTFHHLDSQRLPFSDAFRMAFARLLPVIGFYMLLMLAGLLLFLLLMALFGGLIAAAPIIGGILLVLLLIVIFPLMLYLQALLLTVVPVIVVEGLGLFEGISRSLRLTKEFRWPVVGLLLILFLVYLVASIFLQLFALIPMIGLIALIGLAVLYVAYVVVYTIGPAVVYYQLRVTKEGISPDAIAAAFD